MISFLFRLFWRIVIFAGGGLAIYFVSSLTYQYADARLNFFVAAFLVYCLLAYGLIPLLFRLYHVVFKHDHIPVYATTGDGWASDPINLAITCRDRRQLIAAMSQAGWYEADHGSLKNLIREGLAIVFNLPYPESPVSGLYFFNRRHDLAFQIPTNPRNSPRSRHHVRFWRLEEPLPHHHDHHHFAFWKDKLQQWITPRQEIWIGACTEDTSPFGLRYRTGTITHRIDPDPDKERDFIIKTLKDKQLVASVQSSRPGQVVKFRSQQAHRFISDGSLKIVNLKAKQ